MPEAMNTLANPTLHYRLDPGEPGLLRSAPATHSQIAVTAQERHNAYRFSAQAARSGERVVFRQLTYTRAISGSFPSIRAGHTTVITQKNGPGLLDMADITRAGDARRAEGSAASDAGPARSAEAPNDGMREIESAERALFRAKTGLRAELVKLRVTGRPGPLQAVPAGAADGGARAAERDVERRLDDLNMELRRMEFEKLRLRLDHTGGPRAPVDAAPVPAAV